MKTVKQNCMLELEFRTAARYEDPFNELEFCAIFTEPGGNCKTVPGFWAGDRKWKIRYSSSMVGVHSYRTASSSKGDSGLNGKSGEIMVEAYRGKNPLLLHGPVEIAADKRHFQHSDGTPFFWLGDTWWMGLCKRLTWPKGFQMLASDRVEKGFTVVQIVAGLYPDMPAFDERGANEAGFPWDKEYKSINPRYFDMADRRIKYLVESGLVPCIVACWGYFLPWMGMEKMKKHWRNLVARYGSYPVLWCLAGEGIMPYYLSTSKEDDRQFQKNGWNEMAVYMRQIDPYRRPITMHPGTSGRKELGSDPGQVHGKKTRISNTVTGDVLDFDMLQTGHGFPSALPNTIRIVNESYHRKPAMPVVEGEVLYDGIGGTGDYSQAQRWLFWACILNGVAGYTYGANGIWQLNTLKKPYGPSPHGMSWGDTPWELAYQLSGSAQLGIAKRLLERYEWWKFEPHQEWVEPGWTKELNDLPFTCGRHDVSMAAGIPGKIRIIYRPMGTGLKTVKGLEKGVRYQFKLFNPINGTEVKGGEVKADASGNWNPAFPGLPSWNPVPIFQDWVIVMEAKGARR